MKLFDRDGWYDAKYVAEILGYETDSRAFKKFFGRSDSQSDALITHFSNAKTKLIYGEFLHRALLRQSKICPDDVELVESMLPESSAPRRRAAGTRRRPVSEIQ